MIIIIESPTAGELASIERPSSMYMFVSLSGATVLPTNKDEEEASVAGSLGVTGAGVTGSPGTGAGVTGSLGVTGAGVTGSLGVKGAGVTGSLGVTRSDVTRTLEDIAEVVVDTLAGGMRVAVNSRYETSSSLLLLLSLDVHGGFVNWI